MKKALFMVALYLVPFLSVKADVSNIFEDGTVFVEPPNVISEPMANCSYPVDASGVIEVKVTTFATCIQKITSGYHLMLSSFMDIPQKRGQTNVKVVEDLPYVSMTFDYEYGQYNEVDGFYGGSPRSHTFGGGYLAVLPPEDVFTCPPANPLSYKRIYPSYDSNGDVSGCSDPEQINQVDSCNASSGNEYLTIEVSAPSGCFPQPDGSICKYDAVDVGGGNPYYALDLEGDCYSENELPDLEGTPEAAPVGEECADYGNGVVGCPEDPANVCSSGSEYAGGSIQDCQTGCGMINDQFMCIDQDTDSDGVPDYKDEDSNENSDCPVGETCDESGGDTGTGECPEGETCTGGGGGAFDDSGIIAELKKLNKDLVKEQTFADGTEVKNLLDDKKTELETKTTEFLNSTELSDIENFADKNNIQADFFQINDALSGSSCSNPSHSNLSSFDICQKIIAVRPYLYILFGVLTFITLIYRFAFYIKGN